MRIDKIDWKILRILSRNSRLPLSKVAKEAGISKQSGYYRLKGLELEGVITGYHAKANSAKLGYSTYAIYFRLFDVTSEDEKQLIQKILAMQEVRWLVSSTGKWDLMFSVSARNNHHFDEILKRIMSISYKHVLQYETAMVLSTQEVWLSDISGLKKPLSESVEESCEIDKTDRKILSMLQKNARTETTVIGRETGLSAEAVAYRIKNLLKNDIIHSFCLEVSKEALGLTWYQIQLLLNNPDDIKKVLPQLISTGNLGYMVKTLGKWNFELHLYCKDIRELRESLLKIRSILSKSIRDYETNIILKKHKSETFAQ